MNTKRKRVLLIACGVIFLLGICVICSIGGWFLFNRGSKVASDYDEIGDLMNEMCGYVGRGDYEDALELMSEEAQDISLLEYFEKLEFAYKDCEEIVIDSWGFETSIKENTKYSVSGIVHYKGADYDGSFAGTAIKEGGEWRIYWFNLTKDIRDVEKEEISD